MSSTIVMGSSFNGYRQPLGSIGHSAPTFKLLIIPFRRLQWIRRIFHRSLLFAPWIGRKSELTFKFDHPLNRMTSAILLFTPLQYRKPVLPLWKLKLRCPQRLKRRKITWQMSRESRYCPFMKEGGMVTLPGLAQVIRLLLP